MKDSEIVSKLIFLAFIAAAEPVAYGPDDRPLLTWSDAMGLHARCVEREAKLLPDPLDYVIRQEFPPEADPEINLRQTAEPEVEPEPEQEAETMKPGLVLDPPPIFPPQINPLEDTVPLRAKEIKAELSTVPKFVGKGSAEKRATFARMNRFRETHRTQAFKVAAEASDGALTEWQLRDMMECKPAPMCRWKDLAAALDRLEVL